MSLYTVAILEDGNLAEVLPEKFDAKSEEKALEAAQKFVDDNRALAEDAHEYKLEVHSVEEDE